MNVAVETRESAGGLAAKVGVKTRRGPHAGYTGQRYIKKRSCYSVERSELASNAFERPH